MNPRGEFGALYVALDKETASAELYRKAEQAGVPASDLSPRRVLTVDVSLDRVLDLTGESQQEEWGISAEELASSEYETCHEVARAARRAGYEAILFPSATGTGNNLAIFLDRLRPGSRVEIVGNEPMDVEGGPV